MIKTTTSKATRIRNTEVTMMRNARTKYKKSKALEDDKRKDHKNKKRRVTRIRNKVTRIRNAVTRIRNANSQG